MKKILLLLTAALLCVGNTWAEIAWVGEPISSGNFYIYNTGTQNFLNDNNVAMSATPNCYWHINNQSNYFTASSEHNYRLVIKEKDKCTTNTNSGATDNYYESSVNGAYKIYVQWTAYVAFAGNKTFYSYFYANGTSLKCDAGTRDNKPTPPANNSDWYFIGTIQYANHNALVAYETANNVLAGYNANNLPNALWNQIKDAVNSTTNYLSYSEWLKTTDKSANIASATNTLTTFSTTYGSTISATSSAYTSALANEFAEVESALATAEEGAAKNALQEAYDTALTDIEAAESASTIADVVSTLSSALSTYYLTNKPQPSFNKNYADAAASLLVDGTIENAFIIQNAPSYTISYKDNDALVASATSNVITFSAGTITAIGAGSVTLVLDQAETAEVKAGHAEFTFTVSKNPVVITKKNGGKLAWNSTFNFETIFNCNSNGVATITSGDITISDNTFVTTYEEKDVTIHVSIQENNKYVAFNGDFIFTIAPQIDESFSDMTEHTQQTSFGNTGTTKAERYSWNNPGTVLSFDAYCGNGSFKYFEVWISSDGNGWNKATDINETVWTHYDINITNDIRYVEFRTTAAWGQTNYYRNIRVAGRADYLRSDKNNINAIYLSNSANISETFTVSHSNVDNMTIVSSNPSLTVTPSQSTNNTSDCEGEFDVTVSAPSTVGTYSGDIIIYDRGHKLVVPVSISVASSSATRTALAVGSLGTVCYPFAIETVAGGTLYDINYKVLDGESNPIYINFSEATVPTTAGRPYIFVADGSEVTFSFTTPYEENAGVYNGLHGSYALLDFSTTAYNSGDLYTIKSDGQEIVKTIWDAAGQSGVYANRAFIVMSEVPVEPTPAPGRSFDLYIQGQNPVATGLENATMAKPAKALINGKIVILRGNQMFDLNGMLVK